ncbi:hypothetical protein CHS0354_015502 [Potamilus streckersoni]|uniref:TRADD-like N-terminal domain-containing protein n=1 Tax=Potamilus streckersoni TaxID=2493646 RepID=A0AAE0W3R4_9BIVA|nr:hypothetical protein CHS0354_015502 [Potamilus streckersoni]
MPRTVFNYPKNMQNYIENTYLNNAEELHTMKDSQSTGILSRRGNMNKSHDFNNDTPEQWHDKLKSSRQDNMHPTGVVEQKTPQNLPEMVEPSNSQCRERPSFDMYQQGKRAPQEASYNIPTPPLTPQKHQTMTSSVLDSSKIDCDGSGKTEGGYLSRQSTRSKASFPSPISIVVDDSEENETESPTKFDRSLSDFQKHDIIQSLKEMNEEHREYCFRVLESAMKNRAGSSRDVSTIPTSDNTSLQDSLRPNLKRQLSRDSFEERVNFRGYKRVSTRGSEDESADGHLPSCNDIGINQTVCCPQSIVDSKTPSDNVANIPVSISTNYEKGIKVRESEVVPEERLSACRVSAENFGNTKYLYEYPVVPESPDTQHFNLKDIALTSPFLSISGRQDGNGSVFIFPDVTTGNDLDSNNDQIFSEESCKIKENGNRRKDIKGKANDFPNRDIMQADDSDSVRQYISKTGFFWPENANNTQPILFSPRIVTGHAQPKFPMTSKVETCNSNSLLKLATSTASNLSKAGDYQAMVRRDPNDDEFISKTNDPYARSIMGNDNPQLSPSSREINEILRRSLTKRSISDIERSPSEKEIREMRRETDRKYDRSWSDPTFDPRQQRVGGMAQNRKPFNIDPNDEIFCDMDEDDYAAKRIGNVLMRPIHEKRRDPWASDVRRKLFGTSYDDKDPLSGSFGIPEDVARFFHSRNFHPEDLQNLREIFQRSKPILNDPFNRSVFHNEDDGYHLADLGKRFDNYRTQSPYCYQEIHEEDDARLFSTTHAGIRRYKVDRGFHSSVRYPSWDWGSSRHRLRRKGDIDLRLTCDSIAEKTRQIKEILKELKHDDKKCDCSKVEEEILTMARDAFAKIRRQDDSKPSFQQFSKELQETNDTVYQSLKILAGMKSLCKYGRSLEDILPGSVIFRLNCPNLEALEDLWATYRSGTLLKDLEEAFVTDELKHKFSADSIKLMISISEDDYTKCKYELGHTETKQSKEGDTDVQELELSTPKKPSAETQSPHLNVVHVRSRSAPVTGSRPSTPLDLLSPLSRERKFSDSSIEQSPRRAFQEINVGKDFPCSPTRKSFLDNLVWTDDKSPKASPKRKTFGFKPPWEHENFHPELESPIKSPRW